MVTGVLKNKVQALCFTKEGTEAAEGKGPAGGHRDREGWPLASGSWPLLWNHFPLFFLSLFFFFFWLLPMWDFISPTRDQTHAPCSGGSGSLES